MKKMYAAVLILFYQGLLFACPPPLALDKISFQVSAKQWVTTESALLTININATLNNGDIVKTRADIMNNLQKIASGDWHITQFDRSQDSSGLEKLFVAAQVRLPQAALTDVYQHAKAVTKPGSAYSVNGIDFTPGLEEVQKAKAQLREKLYQLVAEELTRINKTYPEQHYAVNSMVVYDGDAVPMQPRAYQAKETMNTMTLAAAPSPLIVGNELVLNALVDAASTRMANKVNNASTNP